MNSTKRHWSLWFIAAPFVAVVILALLRGESIRIIGDIIGGRYDERRFYYWSFYYKDWFLLVIPISFLILFGRWLYVRQKNHPDMQNLTLRRVLIALAVASVLAIGWLIITSTSSAESPTPEHIGTVQVLDKTYYLDRIFFTGGDDRYVLYACDLWGCGVTPFMSKKEMRVKPLTSLNLSGIRCARRMSWGLP